MFKDLTIKTGLIFLVILIYTIMSFANGSYADNFKILDKALEKYDIDSIDKIDDVKEFKEIATFASDFFSIVALVVIVLSAYLIHFVTLYILFSLFLKNLILYFLSKGSLKKWKLIVCRVLWILGMIEVVLLLSVFLILSPFINIVPYIGVMIVVLIFILYYNIKIVRKNGLFKKLEI